MTNGEYVTKIVEQDEDFCILTDDVAETVTIEVSLDWWNKPKTDVLDKIRAIAIKWQNDTWWTDNVSYECMQKIADLIAESEDKE